MLQKFLAHIPLLFKATALTNKIFIQKFAKHKIFTLSFSVHYLRRRRIKKFKSVGNIRNISEKNILRYEVNIRNIPEKEYI